MSFSSNIIFKSIPSLKMQFSRLFSRSSMLRKKVSFFIEDDDGSKYRITGNKGSCYGTLACGTCHVKFSKEVFDKMEPPCIDELDYLDKIPSVEKNASRLSCKVLVMPEMEDAIIKIPDKLKLTSYSNVYTSEANKEKE